MATDVEQSAETERVVRAYLEQLERGDADAPLAHFADDATEHIHGLLGPASREETAAFFREMRAAFPGWHLEVLDVMARDDRAAVRWRMRGIFAGPGSFQGLEPNGARLDIEGMDLFWVAGGMVQRVEVHTDNMTVARQLGTLPPQGSKTEARMARAFNVRTRAAKRLVGDVEPVTDGVWLLRGGFPVKEMNVYFIREGDGVLVYDAGIKAMTNAVAAAGASLGGITRVVLGHAHADHRGIAAGLGVPVWCHPADRADAEGDGGAHYFDFSKLSWWARPAYPYLLRLWDGGPVEIADTVEEGDDIAGFKVVHLPGHAPGLIGLWRESDRLALVSDCFYTLDPETGRHGGPRVPLAAFNYDTEQARESIRKLAALEPSAAWPGHANPVTGDVRAQLEEAAATT